MEKKILIVGPSWVGDMVMAQSLFKALKQKHPVCSLAVLAPAWTKPLLQRMPEVDEAIAMPVGHGKLGLSSRWRLARELKWQGFDQAIVLPGSLKAALVPWLAGIKQRTGFVGEQRYGLLNDRRQLDKKRLPLNVQRFVDLSQAKGAANAPAFLSPSLLVDTASQQEALKRLGLSVEKPVLVLCPGAEYGPAKQWPAQHFAELAQRFAQRDYAVWVVGSDKDRPFADEINQLAGEVCRVLAGDTTLGEVVDLMALADAVVSNDSGLMHVAAALGRQLVALYGSSSPDFTPPLSEHARVVQLSMDCRPCFKRVCPLGHTNCLQNLTVDQVLEALAA